MNVIANVLDELKAEGIDFTVEIGCKDKERKKEIVESIKKIKDSGDQEKILYTKNLQRYYSIFNSLNHLLKSNPIIDEKGNEKYYTESFYHYLDNSIDSSKRIITAIISCIANDKELDSFHKNLMFPDIL